MNQHTAPAYKSQPHGFAVVMLVLLIILGAIERVYGIDRQSLWSDELFAVMASYKISFMDVWRLMLTDSHPPGYVSFMYWMLPLTGYSDFGIRLHALVFGIAWIPLVFWLGRRWFSVSAGLLAATIIASAYTAVYYSQEARAYTMLIVFNLINLICLFEILFAENILRRYVIGFIISSLAMLYLHYTGFVFLAAEILLYAIFWLVRQRQGSIREALILFGIPLLLYSPWLGVMYANVTNAPQDWSVSKAPTLVEVYNTMQRLLGPDDSHMKFHVVAIALALCCALFTHVKSGISKKLLVTYSLFFLMAVPIFAFYIESWVATPIFEKRYFLSALVIDALLIAGAASQVIGVVAKKWKVIMVFVAVIFFSVWTINSNVEAKLYTSSEKDPVRDAVGLIKEDLGKDTSNKNYTVLMTHEWFEHYLKRSKISFDSKWPFRSFYVPQQITNVDEYLTKNKNINYFYYLSLRQPNSEAAAFSLKQQYKLLSTAAVSVGTGTIDVFKFSAKELPDDAQIDSAGSNPSNELAKLVAQDINQKDPATYRVLMTHKWVLPYLRRNKVNVDETWDAGNYVINAQADQIFSYVHDHPEINTLYYLALEEPNAEGAAFMLQSRYLLADEKSVQTSVGKMNILKFNVNAAPVVTDGLLKRMRGSKSDEVAQWVFSDLGQAKPETYAVATANGWMEPYLKLNGVAVDDAWAGRRYDSDLKAQGVFDYVDQHPAISSLYYIALRNPGAERAVLLLQLQYQLVNQATIDVVAGKMDIYKFNTKSKPLNVESIKEKIAGGSSDEAKKLAASKMADLVASDIGNTNPATYRILMTHKWMQPSLEKAGVQFDKAWDSGNYVINAQADNIYSYVQNNPDIETLYYLALQEPNSEGAALMLQFRYQLEDEKSLPTSFGNLEILKFNVKTASVVNDSLLQSMHASPADQAAQWVLHDIGQAKPDTYAIAMANEWMESYFKLNNIAIDNEWTGRKYISDLKAQDIFDYLEQRPAVNTFYYIALHDPGIEPAVLLLRSRYALANQTAIATPSGNIDIYKFDTKSKPQDIALVRQKAEGNPLSDLAGFAAKDIEKIGKNSAAIIMTHNWFQPYLNLHNVDFDAAWPGRFFINSGQFGELLRYLQAHPEIEHVYYLGLAEPGLQPALEEIKRQMNIGCKQFITAPIGTIKLIRFDVKAPLPAKSAAGVTPAACGA